MQQVKRLFRAWRVLRRRGFGYVWYLLIGYLIPKLVYQLVYRRQVQNMRRLLWLGVLTTGVLLFILFWLLWDLFVAILVLLVAGSAGLLAQLGLSRLQIMNMYRRARTLTKGIQSTYDDSTFTSWAELPVDTRTREAIESARKANPGEELVIGRIDHDIRVLGLYGEIPILPPVNSADFSERPRFSLDIVLVKDKVMVRKDFRGDRMNFVREWRNLTFLYGKANVPAIYRVDEGKCILYKNLILGRIVRDILLDAGAKIMNVQTRDDPEFEGLDKKSRLERIVARGSKVIPSCLTEKFLSEMEHQIDIMHSYGFTGVVPTFGNVIVGEKSSVPWFIDFEGTRYHRSTCGLVFHFRRDQDRVKLNQCFGRNLLTEVSARADLATQIAKMPNWYAPIDFGRGLTIGGFWSIDSGTGRWEFINKHVVAPLVLDKRVLDLGSNNGLMPVMMLRAGAHEVIAVERLPDFVESAKLVKQIFEWRDIRQYALRIRNCDMLDMLQEDWGHFDVVTAFCSLYYLQAKDMARVVHKASELAPIMVVQAKTTTRRDAADNKAEKSSVPFLKNLLEENGFPSVEVYAPQNYSRPLLVGKVFSG